MTDDELILFFDPFAGDFGEPGDRTLSNRMVVGRKAHECHHCGGPIAVGERHRHQVEVFDGGIIAARWCAACCSAMVAEANADADAEEAIFAFEERANKHRDRVCEAP